MEARIKEEEEEEEEKEKSTSAASTSREERDHLAGRVAADSMAPTISRRQPWREAS